MSFSAQPLALAPLPGALEAKGFNIPTLQKALSLQPSLASSAASKVMGDPSMSGLGAASGLSLGTGHTDDQLRKVSKDFESIFLRMIFKQMRSSVERSSLLGNSRAMEFFETLRDEQLADSLAKAGGLGIGDMVYQRLQEATVPHLKTLP
jgi:hypothetical protein